ncbi:MAG: hypothetical protein II420_00125, partial [Oscillospiraceae bacterium]|nr:hypothetical protein [Oscillospiraceae bacterium]
HAKAHCRSYPRLCGKAALIGAVFLLLMILLRTQMLLNIALSAVFVFALFSMIYRYGKAMDL